MKIEIPYEPQQQERPRYTSRGRFVKVYDPKKTANFKKAVRAYVTDYMLKHNMKRFETPISVTFVFYRGIQKSLSNVEKRRRINGIHPPEVKPDLSNYLKSMEDALNGVVWSDDAKIISEELIKLYSERPRIEILVEEWNVSTAEQIKQKMRNISDGMENV